MRTLFLRLLRVAILCVGLFVTIRVAVLLWGRYPDVSAEIVITGTLATMVGFVYLVWGIPVTVQLLGLWRVRQRFGDRFSRVRVGGTTDVGYKLWVCSDQLIGNPIVWVQKDPRALLQTRARSSLLNRRPGQTQANELADAWFGAVYPDRVRSRLSELFVSGRCALAMGRVGVRVDANSYRAVEYVHAAELAAEVCDELEKGLVAAPKLLTAKLARAISWQEARLAAELLLLLSSDDVVPVLSEAIRTSAPSQCARLLYGLSLQLPPTDVAEAIPHGLAESLLGDELSRSVVLGSLDPARSSHRRVLEAASKEGELLIQATALCRLAEDLEEDATKSRVQRVLRSDEPEAKGIALLRHPMETFVATGLEVLRVVGGEHALTAIRFGRMSADLKSEADRVLAAIQKRLADQLSGGLAVSEDEMPGQLSEPVRAGELSVEELN